MDLVAAAEYRLVTDNSVDATTTRGGESGGGDMQWSLFGRSPADLVAAAMLRGSDSRGVIIPKSKESL